METIETIRTNAATLAHVSIDWSPSGGMFWLTSMVVGLIIMVGFTARDLDRS
jgi:hypothetical protein